MSIRRSAFLLLGAFLLPLSGLSELVVASLHPVMGDAARQVGGEHIRVIDLIQTGENLDDASLTPEDVQAALKADLVIAAGKGFEQAELLNSLPDNLEVFEMGRMVPSVRVGQEPGAFVCCPAHATGSIDPYWWLSIENVIRASRHLSIKLAHIDPDHADAYRANAEAWHERLEELKSDAKKQFRKLPRSDRKLVTAHRQFDYFSKEFGLKPMSVAGLDSTEPPTEARIQEFSEILRREKIRVVFPSSNMNPELREAIAVAMDVRVGGELLSTSPDPEQPTYEAMMQYNIRTILNAISVQ